MPHLPSSGEPPLPAVRHVVHEQTAEPDAEPSSNAPERPMRLRNAAAIIFRRSSVVRIIHASDATAVSYVSQASTAVLGDAQARVAAAEPEPKSDVDASDVQSADDEIVIDARACSEVADRDAKVQCLIEVITAMQQAHAAHRANRHSAFILVVVVAVLLLCCRRRCRARRQPHDMVATAPPQYSPEPKCEA